MFFFFKIFIRSNDDDHLFLTQSYLFKLDANFRLIFKKMINSSFFGLGLCMSLRILNLNVPSAVRNGSAIYLFCDYELAENEEVYSVKWYKDNVEFYRYLPSNEPYQAKFYRLKGIHLDVSSFLNYNSSYRMKFRLFEKK